MISDQSGMYVKIAIFQTLSAISAELRSSKTLSAIFYGRAFFAGLEVQLHKKSQEKIQFLVP